MLHFRNKPTDPCIVQVSKDGVTWEDGWAIDGCVSPVTNIIYRINQTNYHYEYSIDNGVTWIDDPTADDRFTNPQNPPPTAGDPVCAAAENARDVIKQWTLDLHNAIQSLASLVVVFAAISAYLALHFGFLAPYMYPLVWGLAGAIISLIGTVFDDIFPPTFWDKLLCWLFEAFSLEDFNQSNWVTVASYDYLIARLRAEGGAAAGIIELLVAIGGAVVLAQAASEGQSLGNVCDDCGAWEHHFLSGDGDIPGDTILDGSYSASDDWYAGTPHVPDSTIQLIVDVIFPAPCVITRVRQTVDQRVDNPFTARVHEILYIDTMDVYHTLVSTPHTNTGTFNQDTGIIAVTAKGLSFRDGSRTSGDPDDYLHLTSVTVNGEQPDPF